MVEISCSAPRLTKHIRLVVYCYLDNGTTLHKISVLSKPERNSLKESSLAREGKELVLVINESNWTECLLHHNRLQQFMRNIEIKLCFCEMLSLSFEFERGHSCQEHKLSQQVAFFISMLPERFDDKKLDLISVLDKRSTRRLDLENLFLLLRIKRPNLVLKEAHIDGQSLLSAKLGQFSSEFLFKRVRELWICNAEIYPVDP